MEKYKNLTPNNLMTSEAQMSYFRTYENFDFEFLKISKTVA